MLGNEYWLVSKNFSPNKRPLVHEKRMRSIIRIIHKKKDEKKHFPLFCSFYYYETESKAKRNFLKVEIIKVFLKIFISPITTEPTDSSRDEIKVRLFSTWSNGKIRSFVPMMLISVIPYFPETLNNLLSFIIWI